MAWLAVDKDGTETYFNKKPHRWNNIWVKSSDKYKLLLKGSIKKLIGRDMTWEDDTIELKDE